MLGQEIRMILPFKVEAEFWEQKLHLFIVGPGGCGKSRINHALFQLADVENFVS